MTALAKSSISRAAVRVLVVDDSAVVRGLVSRWTKEEDDIDVVAYAVNGEEAIVKARACAPDVIVLDIEMPRLSGLDALPQILQAAPRAKVIMASTLTQRNAEVTMTALAQGAADYLAKPETGRIAGADTYRRDLLAKIRALGGTVQRANAARAPRPAERQAQTSAAGPAKAPLTKPSAAKPEALFIASSTGGPVALRALVSALNGRVRAPIFIVQHMPPAFTTILADHLDRASPATALEARDGMPVRGGHIYIAPGGYHMTVRKRATPVLQLDQRPPENFCRPAADPLFRSGAEVYGPRALVVVLTGMGQDGAAGAQVFAQAGAPIFIQDEASSVVWGMPGTIARTGIESLSGPIPKLAQEILKAFEGRRP